MSLANQISTRSIDPRTKHGSVAVDVDNNIVASGYNSPPRGCDDTSIPILPPDKYDYFVHSEEACICNAARTGATLKGCRLYVTGHPCAKCFRMIINSGIVEVIYGVRPSACVDDVQLNIINTMSKNSSHGVVLRPFIH